MPADKYDWEPAKGVRSFARQMLHLTYLHIGFGSNCTGQTRNFFNIDLSIPVEEKLPTTKDSVTYYTLSGYDFVINGLKR